MKKAIIVGCNGQDGRLLEKLLAKKRYELLGLDRGIVKGPRAFRSRPIDIGRSADVSALIGKFQPDEIYYLAAFHHSSEDEPIKDLELYKRSHDINVMGLMHFLDGIRAASLKTKLFYAASSHIFGKPDHLVQNEGTPINPNNIYGITKAAGLFLCRFYRETHSVHASTGILYNHESSFRGANFVSKKIITAAINIRNGTQRELLLGDLRAEVDWGYAPDYVAAMVKILDSAVPDDYIVATGQKHQVLDFVKIAFGCLGLDWKAHVEEKRSIVRKKTYSLVGDPKKLSVNLGWKPSVDFNEMVKRLLKEEGAFDRQP